MAAATYDFIIEQGTTFRRTLTIKQSDGSALDITGYIFTSLIKDLIGGVLIIDLGHYTSITDAVNGQITINIPNTITKDLDFVTGVYDFEMTTASGEVSRLLQGTVELSKEVTA